MKYKFSIPDCIIQEGYTYISIANGEATIDESNEHEVELAQRYGGVPAPEPKARTKKKDK